MAENLSQYLGDVSPMGGAAARAHDDCGGSELSFRPDARGAGADASSRPPLREVRRGLLAAVCRRRRAHARGLARLSRF
jgi:hypothetical protein